MTVSELGEDKRVTILAIAAKHRVTSERVFGSFARDEARHDSDLDLLIAAGPQTPPWFPGGLLFDLEAEVGRRVDVVEESSLNPLIRDRVLRETIRI
jgi:predicted nucleotidyltransferase